MFSKTIGEQINSSNLEADKMKKAEEIYKNLNIFSGMPATSKQIKPLNSMKLDKKERDKQREQTAGKKWGMMPKVELTEEIKNDLKALKYRN